MPHDAIPRSRTIATAPARFYRVGKQINNLVMPHDTIVRQRWGTGGWDFLFNPTQRQYQNLLI